MYINIYKICVSMRHSKQEQHVAIHSSRIEDYICIVDLIGSIRKLLNIYATNEASYQTELNISH